MYMPALPPLCSSDRPLLLCSLRCLDLNKFPFKNLSPCGADCSAFVLFPLLEADLSISSMVWAVLTDIGKTDDFSWLLGNCD